jgi:hypothetical protein
LADCRPQTTAESASRASLGASPIIRRLQSGEFQYWGLSTAQSLLVQLMQLLCTSTVDTPRLSCEYSPFSGVHVLVLQLCRCEPHYLLLIGMRGSVLQQNFHDASNMHFEELCLVVCICLFSLLFHHSFSFSPRPPFLIIFPVRPDKILYLGVCMVRGSLDRV